MGIEPEFLARKSLLPAELLRLELLALVLLRLTPLRPVVFALVLLALIVGPVLRQAQPALSFKLQKANSFFAQLLNALRFFQFTPFLCQSLSLELQNQHLLLQKRLIESLLLVGEQGGRRQLDVLRGLRASDCCGRKDRKQQEKCRSFFGRGAKHVIHAQCRSQGFAGGQHETGSLPVHPIIRIRSTERI